MLGTLIRGRLGVAGAAGAATEASETTPTVLPSAGQMMVRVAQYPGY